MVKTKCEVYSRVVGYIRPVQQWNDGKQAEFHRRKTFSVEKALCRAEGSSKEVCACQGTEVPQVVPVVADSVNAIEVKI